MFFGVFWWCLGVLVEEERGLFLGDFVMTNLGGNGVLEEKERGIRGSGLVVFPAKIR